MDTNDGPLFPILEPDRNNVIFKEDVNSRSTTSLSTSASTSTTNSSTNRKRPRAIDFFDDEEDDNIADTTVNSTYNNIALHQQSQLSAADVTDLARAIDQGDVAIMPATSGHITENTSMRIGSTVYDYIAESDEEMDTGSATTADKQKLIIRDKIGRKLERKRVRAQRDSKREKDRYGKRHKRRYYDSDSDSDISTNELALSRTQYRSRSMQKALGDTSIDPRRENDIWIDDTKQRKHNFYYDDKGDPYNVRFGHLYVKDIPRYRRVRKMPVGYRSKTASIKYQKDKISFSLFQPYDISSRKSKNNSSADARDRYFYNSKRELRRLMSSHTWGDRKIVDKNEDMIISNKSKQVLTFIPLELPKPPPPPHQYQHNLDEPEEDIDVDPFVAEQQRRTQWYSEQTRKQRSNITLWLDYAHFQEELGVGVANHAPVWEKKLAILNAALKANPHSERLLLAYIQCCEQLWESERTLSRWEEIVSSKPDQPLLWRHYLQYVLSSFATFTVPRIRKEEAHAVLALRHQQMFYTVGTPKHQLLQYRQLMTVICSAWSDRESGYEERGMGLLQAMMELNFFPPDNLIPSEGNQKNKRTNRFDTLITFLEAYWESDCPRIGQENAENWCVWYKKTQEKVTARKASVVADYDPMLATAVDDDVAMDSTVNENGNILNINGKVGNIAKIESEDDVDIGENDDIEDDSNMRIWLKKEQREFGDELSFPALDPTLAANDPERVVLFNDIREHLCLLSYTELCDILIISYLHYLSLPFPSSFSLPLSLPYSLSSHFLNELADISSLDTPSSVIFSTIQYMQQHKHQSYILPYPTPYTIPESERRSQESISTLMAAKRVLERITYLYSNNFLRYKPYLILLMKVVFYLEGGIKGREYCRTILASLGASTDIDIWQTYAELELGAGEENEGLRVYNKVLLLCSCSKEKKVLRKLPQLVRGFAIHEFNVGVNNLTDTNTATTNTSSKNRKLSKTTKKGKNLVVGGVPWWKGQVFNILLTLISASDDGDITTAQATSSKVTTSGNKSIPPYQPLPKKHNSKQTKNQFQHIFSPTTQLKNRKLFKIEFSNRLASLTHVLTKMLPLTYNLTPIATTLNEQQHASRNKVNIEKQLQLYEEVNDTLSSFSSFVSCYSLFSYLSLLSSSTGTLYYTTTSLLSPTHPLYFPIYLLQCSLPLFSQSNNDDIIHNALNVAQYLTRRNAAGLNIIDNIDNNSNFASTSNKRAKDINNIRGELFGNITAYYLEQLLVDFALLLHYHTHMHPTTPPYLMRNALTLCLTYCPHKVQLLQLYVLWEAKARIEGRVRYLMDDVCFRMPSTQSYLFTIWTELLHYHAISTEVNLIDREDNTNVRNNHVLSDFTHNTIFSLYKVNHRIHQVFEKSLAPNSVCKNSPAIWLHYIYYCCCAWKHSKSSLFQAQQSLNSVNSKIQKFKSDEESKTWGNIDDERKKDASSAIIGPHPPSSTPKSTDSANDKEQIELKQRKQFVDKLIKQRHSQVILDYKRMKEVFYRAIRAVPWNKRVWLSGIESLLGYGHDEEDNAISLAISTMTPSRSTIIPQILDEVELTNLLELMSDKELRFRSDPPLL